MRKKYLVIICIVNIFLSLICIFLCIYGTKSTYAIYEEKNVKIYSATINKIEDSSNITYLFLNEYENSFIIQPKTIMDLEGFSKLGEGEVIIFGCSYELNDIDKDFLIQILSLKNEETDIITLQSSRAYQTDFVVRLQAASIIFAVAFFIIAIICAFRIKRRL